MSLARRHLPRSCDRVREQVSLELDGELSQLEQVILERHLTRCAACAEYRNEVAAITSRLREAPLEQPDWVFTLPRRRSGTLRAVQVAAAAATIAVAVGLGSLDAFNRAQRQNSTPSVRISPTAFLDHADELSLQKPSSASASLRRHKPV
jgi:anti-sigma factor RsiW